MKLMDEEKSDLRRAKEEVTKTGNEKTLGGGPNRPEGRKGGMRLKKRRGRMKEEKKSRLREVMKRRKSEGRSLKGGER